jgi:GDP-L-fucose synthase
MRVLITGGAGFVGRHFVNRLQDDNQVVVVDNLLHGGGGLRPDKWYFRSNSNLTFIEKDCRDFFKEKSDEVFDLVIHLAAVVGGRLTIENNPLAVAEDLSIDSEFWKWAVDRKPTNVIVFSSSAAYPVSNQITSGNLLSENIINFDGDLGMPDLTYGWAKLTNEYLGLIAHQKYDMKVSIYRPFSGYGFDQDLSYPFPSICQRAINQKGQDTLHVWGSGLQERDFIHIDDVVDAVLHTFQENSSGEALNLCTGIGTNFIELAKLAAAACGYSPKILTQSDMPEGVFSRVGDNAKLSSTGWKPNFSLQFGIQQCIDYLELQASNG